RKLTREIGGAKLVAIAIAPKPTQPSDPPLYYMLENKVTNRAFAAAWAAASQPGGRVERFRVVFGKDADRLLPGKWRDGPLPPDGKPIPKDAEWPRKPVLGVTGPEAILVAEELGGLLPMYDQWLKAVGAMGNDDSRPGPAGP